MTDQPKRRGPKPKPPEQLRQTITIRVTQAEQAMLDLAAEINGLPTRTYVVQQATSAARRAIRRHQQR